MKRIHLTAARIAKGWSQEEAAGRLGVTRNTLSAWERGLSDPYPVHVHALCEVFTMSAEELDLTMDIQSVVLPADHLWADDLLMVYTQGIAACWDLYFGGSPHQVEAILPLYMRQTQQLAGQPSLLQNAAARLASLTQQLACELFTDREDFGAAEATGKAAFLYAQSANDANLQVASLIHLASLGFHRAVAAKGTIHERKQSLAALRSFEHAVSLLGDQVTPLLRGRTYAGIAEVYAMRGQLQEAMTAMGLAYAHFPDKPEEDAAYPYLRASRYSLYVFGDAQSRLFLGQPKEANAALITMERETNDPAFEPITKLDMLYYQGEIQRQEGNLESTCTILTEAAQLARSLGSLLYFDKLMQSYHDVQTQWPKETTVLALEDVFQPWA